MIDLKSKGWIIIKQQTIHSTRACRAEAYTNINIQIIYNEKYITLYLI
jgi:hypothetical protein